MSDLCECALLTEQTNARSDGLLHGESKVKFIPPIRCQCADCLQVRHANDPDGYTQITLCKWSHLLDNRHTSTHIQSQFMSPPQQASETFHPDQQESALHQSHWNEIMNVTTGTSQQCCDNRTILQCQCWRILATQMTTDLHQRTHHCFNV